MNYYAYQELEWTEMVLFPRIVKMIIKISQRVFVGDQLSQDPEWVRPVISSSFDCTC